MIDIIQSVNDHKVAMVLHSAKNVDETKFFTEDPDELQVGVIVKKTGENVHPHLHNIQGRTIQRTTEVLHFISGLALVSFYDDDANYICEKEISSGATLIQFSGGHAFNFIMDSKLLEIKQGPYKKDQDKKYIMA